MRLHKLCLFITWFLIKAGSSPLGVLGLLVEDNHFLHNIAMFHGFLRRVPGPVCGILRSPGRRALSYVSTHQTFPASLSRFQTHRHSILFDRAFEQDDWEYEDGVEVSADGLVHPNITNNCMRK